MTTHDEECYELLRNLLLAVKECQSRYGGRTELATELDNHVSNVCHSFEAIFSHGLQSRIVIKAGTLIKQAAQKLKDSNSELKPTFWDCIKQILSNHEHERYVRLRQVKTNYGRGRAWLRSTLNEKSLNRYLNTLLSDDLLLSRYYEPWAFLRDTEKSYVLPTTAAGLTPILFAISIDKSELDNKFGQYVGQVEQVIMATSTDILKVNDVGRKIRSTIINFDETDTDSLDYDEMDADKQSEESNHLQPVEIAIDATETIDDEPDNGSVTKEIEENVSTGLRPIGETEYTDVLIPVSSDATIASENSALLSNSIINDDGISIGSCDEVGYQRLYEIAKEQLKQQTVNEEKLKAKILELNRENEVLKHQLRKYVSAVQMLKQEDADHTYEAQLYEKKLVQVAEMHGELMELNSRLQMSLLNKEEMVRYLQEELVSLRGPLPAIDTPIHTLVSLWIPSVFLTGRFSDPHHVYQVHLRISSDEWNIYRRYAQFYEFHKQMKREYALVSTFNFPPKKAIGNKETTFVEERRIKLQTYLRHVLNFILSQDVHLSGNPTKALFTAKVQFFSERYAENDKYSRSHGGIFSGSAATENSEETSSVYSGL